MNDEQLIVLNTTLKKNTLWESLDIRVILAEPERVIGTMPVDERTKQQGGYLHGGASGRARRIAGVVGDVSQY
jgi:1,4-dihydroxy-2-naphthoyl-CoA hydrolase